MKHISALRSLLSSFWTKRNVINHSKVASNWKKKKKKRQNYFCVFHLGATAHYMWNSSERLLVHSLWWKEEQERYNMVYGPDRPRTEGKIRKKQWRRGEKKREIYTNENNTHKVWCVFKHWHRVWLRAKNISPLVVCLKTHFLMTASFLIGGN